MIVFFLYFSQWLVVEKGVPDVWYNMLFTQAGNWLGQITGLLVTVPFVAGAVPVLGAPGRPQTFLPAIVLFVLLALPMLLFLRLPKRVQPGMRIDVVAEYRSQWQRFRALVTTPGMGTFLLAYFFFNDAIITVSNNFPIYLENVYGVSDDVKSLLLLGILLTFVLGALLSGWVTDCLGIKRTLVLSLAAWVAIFPIMGITGDFTVFVLLCVVIGLLFGSIWTVTRVAMTALCPPSMLNFGFSFYTLAERVSTLVGPLAWGIITSSLTDLGPLRYRIAMIAMGFFVAVGLFVLRNTRIGSS